MFSTTQPVLIMGQRVAEMLTNDHAVDNILTFSENLSHVEIWHNEETPQEFEINGITLYIASGGWRSAIGGERDKKASIPATVQCIVARLV